MQIKNFIDLHTHGIGLYDTRTTAPAHIIKIAELHGRAGTGAILPTIYSASIGEMRKNMEAVRKAREIQDSGDRGQGTGDKKRSTVSCQPSTILGIHLEGPFLNPVRCGAQDKDSFLKPTVSNLKKLIAEYEDIVKIITIAPELPGALTVIEKCTEQGIKVNMGHSNATYEQTLDGKKAGACGITHLFNAMRPFHHREPGLAGFGLLDEDIYVEIIADNFHLNAKTVALILKVKRPDRIILVSDSVQGNRNKKGPIYSRIGVLLGTSITLADAVKNLKKIGTPEKTIFKAVVTNPKTYLK